MHILTNMHRPQNEGNFLDQEGKDQKHVSTQAKLTGQNVTNNYSSQGLLGGDAV
jgi:hypothetical protein